MKKRFISSFIEAKFLIARCLTLLILALLSTNLAWGSGTLISSLTDIVEGNYYIAALNSEKYYTVPNTTISGQIFTCTEGTFSDKILTPADGAGEFTFTKVSGVNNAFYIYNTNLKKYLVATGSKKFGYVDNTSSDYGYWTFSTVTSGGFSGKFSVTHSTKTHYMRAYDNSVRCYDGASNNGVYLFKKQADVSVTGVSLNTNTLSLNVGATGNLTATIAPDNATNKNVTWSSNQESVATVSESGVVTAVAAGTATITVTTQDGNKTASCEVTVTLNKLATPANLAATPTSTSATLTWDAVANASKYEVNINNKTLTAETNSLLVEDLTASTAYTWTVKAKGDNTTYEDSESAESNFTTLAPPSVAYTVTFSGNGHGTPASESIEESSAGAGITLPGCTPNAGYQFVGWATSETATEAEYEAGATYYPTANITLYAVYNQVYTITWSVNGAPTTDGNPTTSVVAGEDITTLPTTPADISGMKFQGWTAAQIAESSATKPADLFTDAEHAPAITANTTFYAVFAEEGEGDVTWNKVTTLNGITEGQYVIINGSFYLTNTTITNTGPTAGDAPTISNNIIADANVTATMKWSFTSTGTTNQFYVKNSNDNYLYATSDNNGVRVSTTEDKWTFAENTSGYFSMKEANNNRYCAKYASGSDWRSYTSATHSNYVNGGKLELYKKTQEITYTYYTNIVVKELTSIELSGNYPTEFWKGETFSHEGMTVTAHYENADDENVTDKATFTGYDMATAGEQEVTVTYDTKSTTYNITVKTIANTKETAYTVAEAKSLIDANPAELGTTEVYVKGIVSEIVTAWSSLYNNITYNISEDGETTSQQFQLYRCETNGAVAGDYVIAKGTMKKFGETYELSAGNTIVNAANMTITAANWGTFCAPFDVELEEGVKAYTAAESGNSVAFTEVKTTIPAGIPVVVYSANLINKNYFGALAKEETCTSGALVGVYAATSGITAAANHTNYVLQNNTQGVGFYKATSTISLKANRCYMTLPTSSAAKDGFSFEEIITGINEILNPTKKSVEGIFDLNGRKLAAPQKGINIINGVKVIVK